MKTALLVVFCVDTALAVLFPILYAALAPGWRRTPIGRHFFAYTSVMGALMLLAVVSLVWRAPEWLWLTAYVALGVLLAHRIYLLIKVQRASRRSP